METADIANLSVICKTRNVSPIIVYGHRNSQRDVLTALGAYAKMG